MKHIFNVFVIKRNEVLPSFIVLLYLVLLNAMAIYQHFDVYTKCGKIGYYTLFLKYFRLSGFDPYTYITLSDWRSLYTLERHPLLVVFTYPFSMLNRWLMDVTGMNCAVFIVAAIITILTVYSFIFLFRILKDIIGISYKESLLLCAFFLSFAYIILSSISPDHFGLSLFFLLMTAYIAGKCIKEKKLMNRWATAIFFLLSTGITTTNCVKVGLAQWFANGRKFLNPRNFCIAIVLPACIILGSYFFIQEYIQKPEQERRDKALNKRMKDAHFREEMNKIHKRMDKIQSNSIMKGESFRWTDTKLSRPHSIVENLFGESLMFHEEKMLHDVTDDRPIFVSYSNYTCYVVIGVVILLLLLGIFYGYHHKFMLMCLSWFGFDMFLHLVLGFALVEVYIMTAHWAFIIPIAIAYILKRFRGTKYQIVLQYVVIFLTAFMLVYNSNLLVHYFLA